MWVRGFKHRPLEEQTLLLTSETSLLSSVAVFKNRWGLRIRQQRGASFSWKEQLREYKENINVLGITGEQDSGGVGERFLVGASELRGVTWGLPKFSSIAA